MTVRTQTSYSKELKNFLCLYQMEKADKTKKWEDCADMTKYEKTMLVIAIIGLIIDALALFKYFL